MDIVARHNQTIFKHSNFYNRLHNGEWGNALVVADNGYTNTNYVVTLFINPQNEIENLYNDSIICTRNPLES